MKMKTYNHSFPALDYIFQFFYLFQILTLCLYGISGYEEKEGYYFQEQSRKIKSC